MRYVFMCNIEKLRFIFSPDNSYIKRGYECNYQSRCFKTTGTKDNGVVPLEIIYRVTLANTAQPLIRDETC